MSEFREAIAWQGPARLGFIVYGVWDLGKLDVTSGERVALELKAATPGAEVDPFIATDEGWPCEVGVFDIEIATWPEPVEDACSVWLDVVCRAGARMGWMMFEGMFNEVGDIFSAGWSKHTYAIQGDCRKGEVELATSDIVRQSPDWQRIVMEHRERILGIYPELRSR